MGLFDNILHSEESLFKNPIALDFDFQPKLVPYREDMQHFMANCIKPLFYRRNGTNLFIFGPSGVGKTVSTKHVLNELEENTEEIIPVYINCWKRDSPYKIAVEICEQIGYTNIFNKKADELFREAASLLNKKSVVFVFDEVDKLESHQPIYTILEDIYRKCIFLITNDAEFYKKLDDRLKSRLALKFLEFKPYNFEQTKGILKQRIDYAFVKGVFSEEAFEIIAKKTFELKDIRIGLFLLKEAGNIAEFKSSRRILKEHAIEAISKLGGFSIRRDVQLKKEDEDLLNMIKENSGKTSREIYNIFKEKYGKSYRTFQRKVKYLEEAGLIKTNLFNNYSILEFVEKSKD